nr:HAMP domain-containing sensor histidine kinase [uncultured Sulfurimonas sp.]
MMKKFTIKGLLYSLVGLGILISISYASINYFYTKSFVLESLEQKSINRAYLVAKKLSAIHDKIAHDYSANEHILRHALETAKEYIKNNGRDANLDELKKSLDKSHKHLDFNAYVINSDYVIQRTTYKQDMGLDFKLLPFALKIVDEVYKTPKMIHISHPALDTLANNYKMYILQRLEGEDYMLQLSVVLKEQDEEKEFVSNISKTVPSLLRSSIYICLPKGILSDKINIDKLWALEYKNTTKQRRLHSRDYYKEFATLFAPDSKIAQDDLSNKIREFVKTDRPKTTHIKTKEQYIQKIILPFQSYINMQENTDYILYLEFDESQAQEIIDDMNIALYFIWFSLFGIGAVFLYIIHKHIINPLSLVKSKMQNKKLIDEIDLSNTNNEINSMILIYNQLLRDLRREIISNEELLEEFKIFTQNTVHQVRTPLSVIKIALELIKTEDKEALLQIKSSLLSMEHMYDSLSFILNQDEVVFEKQEINLSEVLQERVEIFNTIALAHDTKIECEIEPNIIVNLNKTEAEFLIDNNISNAIKYSTPKQTIHIRLTRSSADIILLFDSASAEIKDKNIIFQRYKRSDKTKKGTGLGLNIVDSISKKNDILINVEYINGYNRFMYLFAAK